MYKVILFGGTTEGRELAEFLSDCQISALVCVATEYGGRILDCVPPVQVQSDRLSRQEISELLLAERPRFVIDATHPYAKEISENLQYVCATEKLQYLRVLREQIKFEGCRNFEDLQSMVAWLNQTEGMIFAAIGAKEARALTEVVNFTERVVLRMLPLPEGIMTCLKMGYPMKHLIGMQGPFSQELNTAMFRQMKAKILVTKESGRNGGFLEKLAAANACGMTTAVLTRPSEKKGLTVSEVKAFMLEECK